MKHRAWLLSGLLWLAAVAVSAQETNLNPVSWSLKVIKPATVDGKLYAELTAQIESGWHLYALTPMTGGPKPTRITLPRAQAFELAGQIEAPDPFVERDPNFEMEVEYYEEKVTFKLPLKRASGATGDKLLVETRYQTCTSQLCLPPKLVKLEAEAK